MSVAVPDAVEGAGVEGAESDSAEVDAAAPAPLVIKRRGRRVSTEPTPGYLGELEHEPKQSSENDDRLRADVPPHWG